MTTPDQPSMPPVPAMAAVAAQPLPEVLTTDVPCRKCSYNLRGLATLGRCPECGTPVGLSVLGDLLRYSDPGWLDNLRRGVSLIIWGIVAMIFGAVIGVVTVTMMGPVGFVLAMLAGYVLNLIGWWLLTAPDPSGVGEDQYGRARQIIRVALIVGIVSTPMEWLDTVMPDSVHPLLVLVRFGAQIMGVIGLFAQIRYLGKLAARIPDDALEKRAKFLTVAFGGTYVVFLVASLLASFLGGPRAGAAQAAGCFIGVVGLALLVFAIMYLLMIEKFGKRFKEQARYARDTWAAGVSAAAAG